MAKGKIVVRIILLYRYTKTQRREANPTVFVPKSNTEYTFFMKLSPSSHTPSPRPMSCPASAPTHMDDPSSVNPRLMLAPEITQSLPPQLNAICGGVAQGKEYKPKTTSEIVAK